MGAIQLTKRMQIFYDTGAKFHEFPLRARHMEVGDPTKMRYIISHFNLITFT